MKISSLQKGLVGHWTMSQENLKTIGLDLFSGFDFTSADWQKINNCVANNSNTFTTTKTGGIKITNLTVGKKYSLSVRGTTTSSSFSIRNTDGGRPDLIVGFGDIVFTATFEKLYLRNLDIGVTTITKLEIKEVILADKTPHSNDGTIYGATFTTDRKGKANSAMSFDGVDDYIDCGNDSSLDLMNMNEFSLSIWVKTPGTYLLSRGASYANGSYLIYYSGNSFIFKGGASTDTNINIKAYNNWQHIVLTYNRVTNLLNSYNNGVLTKEIIKDYTKGVNTSTSRFGTGDGHYFNGSIDDVRIYNRALSQEEIKTLYNSYNPKIIL